MGVGQLFKIRPNQTQQMADQTQPTDLGINGSFVSKRQDSRKSVKAHHQCY